MFLLCILVLFLPPPNQPESPSWISLMSFSKFVPYDFFRAMARHVVTKDNRLNRSCRKILQDGNSWSELPPRLAALRKETLRDLQERCAPSAFFANVIVPESLRDLQERYAPSAFFANVIVPESLSDCSAPSFCCPTLQVTGSLSPQVYSGIFVSNVLQALCLQAFQFAKVSRLTMPLAW